MAQPTYSFIQSKFFQRLNLKHNIVEKNQRIKKYTGEKNKLTKSVSTIPCFNSLKITSVISVKTFLPYKSS